MGQFLLQSLQEGPIFADTLILDFWLQNCERIKISVVLSYQVCGNPFYGSPRKLVHPLPPSANLCAWNGANFTLCFWGGANFIPSQSEPLQLVQG